MKKKPNIEYLNSINISSSITIGICAIYDMNLFQITHKSWGLEVPVI